MAYTSCIYILYNVMICDIFVNAFLNFRTELVLRYSIYNIKIASRTHYIFACQLRDKDCFT
jgi:hypothetical protein